MRNDAPLISVVMITYNHEKYVAEAIQSVLDQTFENFEFIIVNDGSTDKTDEIIRSFQDYRITYIYQENQGPSAAINNGILTSKGKYIALMSGDDVCYPQRLKIQYQHLDDTEEKIVFSWVDFIDDDSQPIGEGEHFAKNCFNHPNRTRPEILNWFFMKGNYLCAVTSLVEKEILLEFGLFNLASIQLQDFDMWIKIVKRYNISLIEERLVKYRIRSNSNNLSSDPANSIRSIFEGYQIHKNILDNIPITLFKLSFSDQIKRRDFQEGYEFQLEKSFLYLNHSLVLSQNIGVEKLFELLQNQEILSVAKSKYSFGLPELYKLTKDTDITSCKKQAELDQSQSQLQQTQIELERSQFHLQQTQEEMEKLKTIIREIENSKFWKVKKIWFRLKQVFKSSSNSLINIIEHTVQDDVQNSWYYNKFPNLKPLQIFTAPCSEHRINLVTDSINSGSLYGGVGTAIIFCTLIAEKWNCKLRLITRTEKAQESNFFEILKANNIICNRNVEFAFASVLASSPNEIDVCEKDIFVTTSWWTTWSTIKSISPKKIVYLIQEDERMFYAYGDEHLRCTQIISHSEIQFVINSQQLFEHFIYEGFKNIKDKGLWFEPAFSNNLYYCDKVEKKNIKKRFFFYARPNNLRNLFYLGLEVIDSAVRRGILNTEEWELFFVGKDIPQLKIAGFYEPQRIEGLTWSEYAKFIRSVDLGLCLMYTPHPSYPPLDLAASGSVVVTNRFGIKKELDKYSKNIICKENNLESLIQGISEGVKISCDPIMRSQNFEKNQILQDWKTPFKEIISDLHRGFN